MHVLLVDDEKELVSAIAERLNMRGIQTDWVTDGEEAIKMVTAAPYDLAVLDIKMPKIDGLDLKDRLKAIRPEMQFIIATGYAAKKDVEEITCESGKACFLFKPVDIQLLIQRIHELLGHEETPGDL